MDDEDMDERLVALRARVQAKLEASETAKTTRQQVADEELVVEAHELDQAVEEATFRFQAKVDELDQSDKSRLLILAASLILIGSILGMASGALILNGNPDDLLGSSLFERADRVDVSGIALEGGGNGNGVENVTIQLLNIDTDEVLAEMVTDGEGRFRFEDILSTAMTLHVEAEGYITIERDFIPEEAGIKPITMTAGEGLRIEEGGITEDDGWALESAVALSTVVGVFTVITAFVGFQAAVEVRRGKHYRRTQFLAGIALFSRGLIIFGPLMILVGMIILSISKAQFDDIGGD
tara:strand:+ start:1345 stop:2229 length:885 start_codon:yes stop_codon:yes gene_type:complete